VLSTLHTNSAAESVVRLLDLGMDPFNFADALLGVLAQRLVRKLCTHCRVKLEPSVREMEALAAEYCEGTALDADKLLRQWRQGQDRHVRGRRAARRATAPATRDALAVYELMVAEPAVKRADPDALARRRDQGRGAGGRDATPEQDGIDKVIKGTPTCSRLGLYRCGYELRLEPTPTHRPRKPASVAANLRRLGERRSPLPSKPDCRCSPRGGTAVDAILAAAITLTLVEPVSNGIVLGRLRHRLGRQALHGLNHAFPRSVAGGMDA